MCDDALRKFMITLMENVDGNDTLQINIINDNTNKFIPTTTSNSCRLQLLRTPMFRNNVSSSRWESSSPPAAASQPPKSDDNEQHNHRREELSVMMMLPRNYNTSTSRWDSSPAKRISSPGLSRPTRSQSDIGTTTTTTTNNNNNTTTKTTKVGIRRNIPPTKANSSSSKIPRPSNEEYNGNLGGESKINNIGLSSGLPISLSY